MDKASFSGLTGGEEGTVRAPDSPLFSDSISDIRGTLFYQGTISGHSNSNLKLENRCEEYSKIEKS